MPTPAGSDETAVDEDVAAAAKAAEPDMHEDIREQQELIAKLKADREAAKAQKQQEETEESAPSPSQHETEKVLTEDESISTKRPREDEPTELRFNFKEPVQSEEVGERAIATNNRVRRMLSQLPPERKSLAWGALAFAAGLGAMYVHNLNCTVCHWLTV